MSATLLDGKVTVTVRPMFWLVMALIGVSAAGRGTPLGGAVWGAAFALSVLIHEGGHAAACLAFGSGADVVLHGFGGTTSPRAKTGWTTWKRVVLQGAGCAAGGALSAACLGLLVVGGRRHWPLPELAVGVAYALFAVGLALSAFNLLPIEPMDGGRLAQTVLRDRFGLPGLRAAHVLGLATAAAVSLWFLRREDWYGAVLCGVFGFGELRALRRAWTMTPMDDDPAVQQEFLAVVERWKAGEREEAVAALRALREKTKAGLIHDQTTVPLAIFLSELGRPEEAYALLKTTDPSELPLAARRVYASLARRCGDHATALRVARTVFHDAPGWGTAEAVAASAAALGDAREAVAWLRTALRHGMARSNLRAPHFAPIAGSAEFAELLDDVADRD